MAIKNNLPVTQVKLLKELKSDASITIFPADKGKTVVVEDRDTHMAKTIAQYLRKAINW